MNVAPFAAGEVPLAPKVESPPVQEGRYLYCVAAGGERVSLGKIGLEGSEVYSLPHDDICAVVHACRAEPYQGGDAEVVKGWVMAHQEVVEAAWERWGTVLPLSFDTIVGGESEDEPDRQVGQWLQAEYQALKQKLERVRGKAEYGVQIFWDPKVIAQNLSKTNPEIRSLGEEIETKPGGLAYLHRQRLENLIRRAMETKAEECFHDFYARLRRRAADIRVEKTKKAPPGWQMLVNLSCLVSEEGSRELGEELGQIDAMEGFSVRFTGPWPPYSFVGGS